MLFRGMECQCPPHTLLNILKCGENKKKEVLRSSFLVISMWWTDCYLQNTLYMYMHVCVGNLLPTSSKRVPVSTLIPLKRVIFVERKFVKVFLSHNHQCDVVAIYTICPKFYPLQVVKEYQGCHMQPVFCLKPLNNYMYYVLFLFCVCVCGEKFS